MFRVLAGLGVLVLAVLLFRFEASNEKQSRPAPASRIDIIRAYHEAGGETADENLRYVAGYCASEQIGGKAPKYFRRTVADVFVTMLTEHEGEPLDPEKLVYMFIERRKKQVKNYTQSMRAPRELIKITRFFKAWQRHPKRYPGCVYEQLAGRGYLEPAG